MKWSRRELLAALAAAGCSRGRGLHAAVRWLWSHQAADGGWHSKTYGLLASGQSLTPFVLGALLGVASEKPVADGVERALAFMRRHTDAEGAVGRSDPGLADYPNYATALAVMAIARARPSDWRVRVEPMVACLRQQQFTEASGWKPDDAPYGAWGMGGEPRTPPNPGHVDLSMTRHVLQALRAAEVPAHDPVWSKAAVFVGRCQNPDGGFHFSTVVLDANKAGPDGTGYRSYGTATADGVLSLAAIGRPADAARRWLTSHHRADGAPGFTGEAYERWTAGLRFYYAAACSEVLPSLRFELASLQREDGSFVNRENLVKEDDPLIATAFAVRAMAASAG